MVDEGKDGGLCSQLAFQCTICGKETTMATSPRKRNCNEINVRANLAFSELGLGWEALATFCSIIGMPPPSAPSSWSNHPLVIMCLVVTKF